MAKKTRAKQEPTAVTVAMNLLEVRSQINLWKKDEKVLTDTLKTLIRSGEKQDTYILRKDLQLAIADQEKAYAYAAANNLLKVDVPSVDKFLKAQRAAVPEGFGLKETEKLVEKVEGEIAQEEFVITG